MAKYRHIPTRESFEGVAELRQKVMGLDRAEPRKLLVECPDGTDEVKGYSAVWNVDNPHLSCIATNKYKIIQHRDSFSNVLNALDRLKMPVRGYVFQSRRGDYAALELVFPDAKLVDDEKGIYLGVRFSNRYMSGYSFKGEFFAERLVCSNGMVLTDVMKKMHKRHVGDIETAGMIEKFIKTVIDSSDELQTVVNSAMADSVEWQIAEELLNRAFTIDKWKKKIMEMAKTEYGDKAMTRWDWYNLITDLATHGEQLTENIQNHLQKAAQKVLTINTGELVAPVATV